MPIDKLTIEILADGTLKTTSDAISSANHDNAENFIRNVATLAGGDTSRSIREDLPKHVHRHSIEEHERMHQQGIKHEH